MIKRFKTPYRPFGKYLIYAVGCIGLLVAGITFPPPVDAQFIHFSMEVETEQSARTLDNLDFGNIPIRSGEKSIGLGDQGMGIFALKGIRYQRLIIELEVPDRLHHENPDIKSSIPIHLNIAYNNRGQNEVETATKAKNLKANVTLLGKNEYSNQTLSEYLQSEWAIMYLYVYGFLEIDNVPSGIYKNKVTVKIEY